MKTRVALSALVIGAAAAFAWAGGGPARDVSDTLVGTPGATGAPGMDVALAQMTQTLFSTPACPGGQAINVVDDATGAFLCTSVPPRVSAVNVGNGLSRTVLGSDYTLAANGTFSGGFTVSGPSPVVSVDEGSGSADVVFDDDSADPGFLAWKASHQGGNPPDQAKLIFHFKQAGVGTLYDGFTLDGGGTFANNAEFYGTVAASGMTLSSSASGDTLTAQHRDPSFTALHVHGRVDLIGPSGITGLATDGRSFATHAAPNGAAGPSGILLGANTVRLPIYKQSNTGPGAASVPAATSVTATCPNGDIALGGGCETAGGTGDYISSTALNATSFTCTFFDVNAGGGAFTAHVVCMRSY